MGFSALTQRDEARALEALEKQRQLLRPFFPKFHGKEVKTIGDSFLVEFDSALDATNCAIEIQKFLHDYGQSSGNEWKTKIRIGVHLGDVIHQDGDVFGDAVNIASRIEPLADPEGVCLSEQVYDQIHNKISLSLEKLPSKNLKNIQFSIDVYKVMMPWEGVSPPARPSKDRIAILPFINMSPDPADEYFADGLTEELISKLSLVKGLRVVARTSVMRFKNQEKGILEIGKELGVHYIVEGSVRKAANRIRVSAQLIDTESEENLWASSYDKNLDDIFAVQSEIAARIAKALPGNLTSAMVPGGETMNVTAYSCYLKGKQLMIERSDESLHRALDLLKEATTLDPSFARAYVEQGNVIALLGMRSYISFEEAVSGAKTAVQKAIEIDEDLSEAHALLSLIAWEEDFHLMAKEEALRAIELNPNLADAYLRLAYVEGTIGRLKEAITSLERASLLDPLSSDVVEHLGFFYFWNGREHEALDLWEKNRKIMPYIVASCLIEYYLERKQIQKAEEELEILDTISGGKDYHSILSRAEIVALKGNFQAAEETIKILRDSFKGTAANDRNIGFVRYYLGDRDAFFDAMFRAVETHVLDPFRLRYSFLLVDARKDPRYHQVLSKNGIDLN